MMWKPGAYIASRCALLRQVLPEEHPDVARTVFDLAAAVKHSGDNATGGLALQVRARAVREAPGRSSPATSSREATVPRSVPPSKRPDRVSAVSGSKIVFVSDRDGPRPRWPHGA